MRRDLIQAIWKKQPDLSQKLDNVLFHRDNAPAHTAADTQLEILLLGFDRIVHPPYSPDLAPMDFPHLKAELRGTKFHEFSELKIATLNALKKNLGSDWCRNVLDKWARHHTKCVELDWIYFEKEWL